MNYNICHHHKPYLFPNIKYKTYNVAFSEPNSFQMVFIHHSSIPYEADSATNQRELKKLYGGVKDGTKESGLNVKETFTN